MEYGEVKNQIRQLASELDRECDVNIAENEFIDAWSRIPCREDLYTGR